MAGLLCASSAFAQSCTTATCTAAGVSEAQFLAALPSPSNTKATVVVKIPAGTASWTTGINYTIPAAVTNLTIQGAGAISATTGGASTTGTDNTVIMYGLPGGQLMAFTTRAGQSFRFTGISIQASISSNPASNGMVNIGGTSTSVRVDHCHFYVTLAVNQGIEFSGAVQGVADHNYFNSNATTGTTVLFDMLFYNGELWNGATQADGSWADSPHWGTNEFFFVEDSRFYEGGVSDTGGGGRFVFRHNTVVGDEPVLAPQMYWHGIVPSRTRGGKEAEVYANSFSSSGNTGSAALALNSGTALFWGNTLTGGYRAALQVNYDFRATAGGGGNYKYLALPSGWGFCGTAAGGPTNWDGNLNISGYPCLGQPGRGQGDLLTGGSDSNFSATVNSTTGTVAWPHEKLTPIYSWMNTLALQYYPSNPALVIGADAALITANNRDYYFECTSLNLTCSSGFTGAAGTGYGTLANRPSTCTGGTDPMTSGSAPGVAYWATDTNTLYVCNPTNTWTAYYTPYTYPHPLTTGSTSGTSVNPPQNLTVTVQ